LIFTCLNLVQLPSSRRIMVFLTRAAFKSFYDLSAKTLACSGFPASELKMDMFKGKTVLIQNVASLWGTTSRDYLQMNALADKFGEQLVILAFPCNQFGHQENGDGDEILQNLKHVRPGNGYEPKLVLMEKCLVNGEGTHPVFDWLKSALPTPHDEPDALMSNPLHIIWSPVKRSDVSWNFEKFLISAAGAPVKRYSRNFITEKIGEDIEQLIKA